MAKPVAGGATENHEKFVNSAGILKPAPTRMHHSNPYSVRLQQTIWYSFRELSLTRGYYLKITCDGHEYK